MEREIWKHPKDVSALDEAQTPLWFWNDRLEKEELLRQLELQSEVGVRCTNPHARTNNGEGYIGGYLDEQWFSDIKTVVDYKREHGEPMWLYDEIDWPAGTCNKTITKKEENREQYLTISKEEIPAGTRFRAQLKEFSGRGTFGLKPDSDFSELGFNVFIYRKRDDLPYDITKYFNYLIFGPELEFLDEEDAVAYIVKRHVDPYEYDGAMQVNYLDADATKEFLASTYDKYYEHFADDFGSTIRCVFNDETRMCNPIPWSRDFAEEFKRRKGYSILKHLPMLIKSGDAAGRIRCDYFDVAAALFQKNYFGEIHNWCREHDLKLFAHLLGEETLFGHVRYSGDYLRQNRYLDVPGADHLGKGIGSLNIKFTSSGAHSYGKKRTAVEVFAGCGWDMTFEEYIRIITWMYQQGIQIIINHGFFYSDRGNRKNDWPPSQFFQWKGFERMEEGNAMVRRLHYALTDGINEADVLVCYPIETMWFYYEPDLYFTHGFAEGAYLKNEQAAMLDQKFQRLLNGLTSENIDFELLHKDAVENFIVADKKIKNVKSGQQFSTVILPMCRVLPIEIARLLAEYADVGGKVLVMGELPIYAMPQGQDGLLAEYMRRLQESGNVITFTAEELEQMIEEVYRQIPHPVRILEGISGTVNNHPVYPAYLIDPYMHTGEDITGVMFTRYLKDGKRNTLFANYTKKAETLTIEVEALGAELPEIWDTLSGEIIPARLLEKKENSYVLQLTLPVGYGVFVVA